MHMLSNPYSTPSEVALCWLSIIIEVFFWVVTTSPVMNISNVDCYYCILLFESWEMKDHLKRESESVSILVARLQELAQL